MKKTNKTFKRFAAITSASLLAACAMAPVFTSMTSYAAEKEITFTGETVGTHNYTAIKVFSGVATSNALVGDTSTAKAKLENLDWAVDGTATEKQAAVANFLTALTNSTVLKTGETADFKANMTAADVAGVLAGYDNIKAKEFAKIVVAHKSIFKTTDSSMAAGATSATINVSEDGYYVIEEKSLTPNADGDGSYTAYILGVYDASNGAEVKVKADIPSFEKKIKDNNDSEGVESEWQDSADYDIGDAVPYKLEAKLPSNYDAYDSYKLIFHDTLGEGLSYNNDAVLYIDDEKFTITAKTTDTCGENCLEFVIDDLKLKKGDVNGKPIEANAGEKIRIEFTAELTEDAVIGNPGNWNDAQLEYSNNPNVGAGGTTSKTPVDSVVAFTYKTVIDKIDGTTGLPLPGAEFTLQKKYKGETTDTWKDVTGVVAGSGTTFTFTGLDDGEYRLIETKAPTNFNPVNDMYFTIAAEHEIDITSIGKVATGILGNVTGTNNPITYTNSKGETVESATITLGNLLDEDKNPVSGALTATVANYSGASLPGTGGIGTTIFYLGGGAMAAIGGVYLISKRRMKKSEE